MSGKVRAFIGPKYSSKTGALVMKGRKHLKAHQYGHNSRVVFIRPSIDNRQEDPFQVVTHDHSELPGVKAVVIPAELPLSILEHPEIVLANVVLIDEVQFFSPEIGRVVMQLYLQGKRVYVGGLDTDHLGRPFEATTSVVMLPVTRVCKLTAACARCGNAAVYSLRLINGQPAPENSPTFMIENREATYEPVCPSCFVLAQQQAGNHVF